MTLFSRQMQHADPGPAPAVGAGALPRAPVSVTIEGLTKSYGPLRVIDGVSLTIESGEFVSLLGPSGSGKTTILMALAGFVRPDAGSIRFGERDVTLLEPHRRDVGVVFQNYALFPNMTVGGNIAYPLKLRRVPRGEIAARVARALETVQLGGFADRRVDQLSGGQRQRVALARALVFEPRILLMDESLSALDKKLRDQMQIEVRQLHQRLGITTVFVTHDQREAFTMSDRVALLDGGRIVQVGTPEALYENPASRFVADFVGQSFFLPVEVAGGLATLYGRPLLTRHPLASDAARQVLAVRPEKLFIAPEDAAGVNLLSARVRDLIFQGDSRMVLAVLPDGAQIAVQLGGRDAVPATLQPGATIRLGLAPEHAVVLP